ncbi:MAG: hypothetical protein OXG30_07405 [bacterium]|nr:hypothetical protein [bacterium]
MIDGQQRLTTVLLMIRGLLDVLQEEEADRAKSVRRMLFNPDDVVEWQEEVGRGHAQRGHRVLLGAIDERLRNEDPNEPPASIEYDNLKQRSLVINYGLAQSESWDEDSISERADALATVAIAIWPSAEELSKTSASSSTIESQ